MSRAQSVASIMDPGYPGVAPDGRSAARRLHSGAMLEEGVPAPGFTLPDQHGNATSLEDYRGRWLVLWWFPKAFTEG